MITSQQALKVVFDIGRIDGLSVEQRCDLLSLATALTFDRWETCATMQLGKNGPSLYKAVATISPQFPPPTTQLSGTMKWGRLPTRQELFDAIGYVSH